MAGERNGRIAAVVLAAGASSRMGFDKTRLELGGRSLLARAVDAARGAGLDPVVAVTRPGRAPGELPRSARCRRVDNLAPDRGPGSSLATGLVALGIGGSGRRGHDGRGSADDLLAVVVLLADMPFVDAGLVRRLIAAWRRGGRPIAAAAKGGVPMPPVVFGRETLPELARVPPETGGRALLARDPGRVRLVPVPAGRLADLDRPSDLARLARRGGGGAPVVPS